MKVQQALADAMRMLNENAPNDQVIKLKSLEALQKMADGKATKIIIPSEIQGLAGLAASAGNAVPVIRAATRLLATITLHFSVIFIRCSSFLWISAYSCCNTKL